MNVLNVIHFVIDSHHIVCVCLCVCTCAVIYSMQIQIIQKPSNVQSVLENYANLFIYSLHAELN